MANTFKKGIDYFSHDTGMGKRDIKIKLLKAKFGVIGYGVYNLLLEEIYTLGYFLPLSDDFILLFSSDHNLEYDQTDEIIKFCIEKGLFSKSLFEYYGILTSGRIQANYLEATKKRKQYNSIKSEFNLINIDINPINSGINLQKKRNKTKVNKIKGKENKLFDDVLFKWNVFAELNKLPKILKLTVERENYLRERIIEPEFKIEEILEKASQSNWLMKEKIPKLNLDYLITSNSNYIKILEGKYDNVSQPKKDSHNRGNRNSRETSGSNRGTRPGQSEQRIEGNKINC